MFPVAHILFPSLLLAIYNKILKMENEQIPQHYFTIIGFAGILPDLLNIHLWASERISLSHSIFFPLIFLGSYFVFKNNKPIYRDYSLLLFVGITSHLLLDIVTAQLYLFYPVSSYAIDQFVLFPATGIMQNDIVYLNFKENAMWYMFDIIFLVLFLLVEKLTVVENVYLKIKK